MASQFNLLFNPVQIRGKEIRNRIVSTGHGTNYGKQGVPSQRLIDYHVERAKGGCGLIAIEPASVHKSSMTPLIGWNEKLVPDFQRLTAAVQNHGARIVLQIGHLGRQRFFGQRLALAPSPMPLPFFDISGLTPKQIEKEEIQEVVEGWGKAAKIAKESGFDGVEIHSLYGNYLLAGFLSPYSNKRDDEYGGSLDNRLQIVFDVMSSVRSAVGEDFIVGMQLNGDDLTSGGLGIEDYQEIARKIDSKKQIDYLTVKAGTYWVPNMIIPDMQHPLGLWVPFASAIKENTENALIVAVGRINDPIYAENILADGHADMIGMCRAQIADPEMANKAKEARLDEIRPCVACNDGCWGMIYGGRFGCTHNPAVGNEKTLGIGTLKKTAKPKRILVVGGGPGGLKAAEILTKRGHQVELHEARSWLGGQVKIAAKGAGRSEIEGITRYLTAQIEKLGVEVELESHMNSDRVLSVGADAVVVATGSTPRKISYTGIPPFDPNTPEPVGADQGNVLTSWDILEKGVETGNRVVVADDGEGSWKGISIAEYLADREKDIEFLTPFEFARDLTAERRMPLLRRILKKRINITPHTMIKEIKGNSVFVYNIFTREISELENIDNVILAYYHKANDELYFQLKGRLAHLHRIGDCLAPRMIGDAIRDGERVGRLLFAENDQ